MAMLSLFVLPILLQGARAAFVPGGLLEGSVCGPKDTCFEEKEWPIEIPILRPSCQCDEQCPAYDDCCKDSLYREKPARRKDVTCMKVLYSYNVYARAKCPDHWNEDEAVKRGCESDVTNLEDPFLKMPLTNPDTQVTYKNYYCAICHNDSSQSVPWSIQITCDSLLNSDTMTDTYVSDNLVYNKYRDQWLVRLPLGGGIDVFNPCDVQFQPEDLETKTRECTPNLVSYCHPSWTVEDIRQQCVSYMAVVEGPTINYRNIYCAICNFANVTSFMDYNWCITPGGAEDLPPPFSILFRVNEDKDTCADNEVFDKFAKKCRRIACLPWMKLVNGVCINEHTSLCVLTNGCDV